MKSKKIIASLMALSIVGSSGVVFNSVQASEISKVTKHQSTLTAQHISDSYSIYCTLSHDAVGDIYMAYLTGTDSSKSLANYIESKGYATRTVADTIARVIVLNGFDAFAAQVSYDGISFLKSPIDYENKYTMVPMKPGVAYYDFYCFISKDNVKKIIDYLNKQSKPYSKSSLSTFLINNGIWSSSGTVYALSEALCDAGPDRLNRINDDGVYILKSNRNDCVAAPSLIEV